MGQLLILLALLLLLLVAVMLRRKSANDQREKSTLIDVVNSQVATLKAVSSENDDSTAAITSTVERLAAVNKMSEAVNIERQEAKPATISPTTSSEENMPEDSTLRRHYASTRLAEREAVIHPYPTDSALRRHQESLSASALNQGNAARRIENTGQSATTLNFPEDSTLRRHFLTQVRYEVELELPPCPTDSVLRRHYESLVSARMDAYLARKAA